jgi:hypothetical protein
MTKFLIILFSNYPISLIPFINNQDMNSFSPSLVLAALNFGDKMVPTTKAVNGIQNPVKLVNLANKYWIEINNIAKQPSWYRNARTCNFVIIFSLKVYPSTSSG